MEVSESQRLNELANRRDTRLKNGVSKEENAAFETANHVRLPEQYKLWLQMSDGGELFGSIVQLCGVISSPKITRTMECQNGIRMSHYVIGYTCEGDHICFEDGSDVIFVRGETQRYFKSFIAFESCINDLMIKIRMVVGAVWVRERQLILSGRGTRNWNVDHQKKLIYWDINEGFLPDVFDEKGIRLCGHRMYSISKYPQYMYDQANVQFLTLNDHMAAHNTNLDNVSCGYFDETLQNTYDFRNE